MAKLMFVGTCGSEHPTKSVLPLLSSIGAREAGHEATIAFLGDSVVVMKDVVANAIVPVGWPPFKELMAKVIQHQIPIYVWGGCSAARGVTEEDLKGKNASFVNPKQYAELVVGADRVVSYWASGGHRILLLSAPGLRFAAAALLLFAFSAAQKLR